MYQFARWKYWLVIIVVVSGTLLALPNVFGEGPALQLSRNDRTAMDQAAQQRVLGVLETQKITPEVSYLQKDRLVLRFADDRQQTSAREAILKGTSGDYLVALSSVPRMPEWMRHVPFFKPMSLGLDLRGGVHFVYEVDIQSAVAQAIERMERDVRTSLRDKRIPFEMCPSSNVQTGAVGSIAEHPFDLLARLRFRVTVNTDNRLMSDTTMSLEMLRLVEAFGYGWSDLQRFTINAMKSAFISFDERLAIIDDVIKPRFAVLVG